MKTLRIFLIRFLPTFLIILGISAWAISMQHNYFLSTIHLKETKGIKSDLGFVDAWLTSKTEDTVFIRNMVRMSLEKDRNREQKLSSISELFLKYAKAVDGCLQIRLLTPEGRESVRVNINNSIVSLVPENELQDKSNRYYFKDALKHPDKICFSKIDLNIEHKKIELPFTPVIRVSSCIHDSHRNILGILVLNFDIKKMFKIFNADRREFFGRIYIVTEAGGLISGPDHKKEWGFITGNKDGYFQSLYPAEWKKISKGTKGSFFSSNGLFFYERYSALSRDMARLHNNNILRSEDWVVISKVSAHELYPYWWIVYIVVIVIVFVWSGVLTWKRAAEFVSQQKISEALRKSEQRFKDVTGAAGGIIWETDMEGFFTFITGHSMEILGFFHDELIGKSPFDFISEEDSWDIHMDFLDAAKSGHSFNNLEYRFRSRTGDIVWLSFNGVPVVDSYGVMIGFRGTATDITDRKKSEQELRENEELLSSVSNSVQDALILIDETGVVRHFNPAAIRLFRFSAEDFDRINIRKYVRLEDDGNGGGVLEKELFFGKCNGNYEGASCNMGTLDVVCSRSDGSEFYASVAVSPLKRSESWWIVWSIRDITDRKEAEEKLFKLATTDSLTGLLNRRSFMEKAKAELARAKRYNLSLSILMLDIDHFKRVNDSYGHDAGDDVLESLSNVGLGVLRKVDIFGRIGGEEFSVLLPDTALEGAVQVAERLREEVQNTVIKTRSGDISITVSIGVSSLNEEINSLEHLLKTSDIALYTSKRQGRNRVSVQSTADGTVD